MDKGNKRTTKRRSRYSRTRIYKNAKHNWDDEYVDITSEDNMTMSGSDDCALNITKELHNLAAVMQNVPLGGDIDLCPSGSIRQRRLNKLADDIQFVNQLASSDSDISLDLDELDDPGRIQNTARIEKFSTLRRKFERSQGLVESRNSKTWTEELITSSEKFTNKYNEIENRTMPIRKDLEDFGKEKVIVDKNCTITPCVQLDVKISEKVCTSETKKLTKLKEDLFSNFSFHLINDKPYNAVSKLSKK